MGYKHIEVKPVAIGIPIQVKYARVGAIWLYTLGGLRQRPLRCTALDRELLYPLSGNSLYLIEGLKSQG
jgi:hypothetical protein